jgi:hypothetical protein
MTVEIHPDDIAPCGMDCGVCYARLRIRNRCSGCRADDSLKPKTRVACRIKNCERLSGTGEKHCFGCDDFPCQALKHLDKRYRTKCGMSMIENLKNVDKLGLERFCIEEAERWTCPGCGGTICVHRAECPSCGRRWR